MILHRGDRVWFMTKGSLNSGMIMEDPSRWPTIQVETYKGKVYFLGKSELALTPEELIRSKITQNEYCIEDETRRHLARRARLLARKVKLESLLQKGHP